MSLLVFVVSVMPESVTIYCLKIKFFFLGLCFWQSHTDLINPLHLSESHFSFCQWMVLLFIFFSCCLRRRALGLCEVILSPIIFHKQIFERSLAVFYVRDSVHGILGKRKQLWYRRHGGGKAFINSIIGVQSGIKYDHFCPYATHFIYITVKSVQGPKIFLTMKCVIC